MQNLYEIIGRQQEVIGSQNTEIQKAYEVQRAFLNIIHGIKTGEFSVDRITVDLEKFNCTISQESQPDPTTVPVEE